MSWCNRRIVALGLMLGLLAVTQTTEAQVRVDAPGVNVDIGRVPWFSHPTVRQQLKLDDDQYGRLNKSYTQYWTRYNQGVTGLGRDLNEEQRLARRRELYGTFHKDFNTSTREVLTDAQLRDRYNQLHWQYQGYGAFNDPVVVERLELTPDQRERFNRYYADWNSQLGTWRKEYDRDRVVVVRRYNDSRKEARDRINATLNDRQRRTWTEMIGDGFDFPAEVYFDTGRRD